MKYIFKKQLPESFIVECPECNNVIEIKGDAKEWDKNDTEYTCKKCKFTSSKLDYVEIKNMWKGGFGCLGTLLLPVVFFILFKDHISLNVITVLILCGTLLIGMLILGVFFWSLAFRDMTRVNDYLAKSNRHKNKKKRK